LRYGIVADTHNRVLPSLFDALAGVEEVLHAGDVCRRDVLAADGPACRALRGRGAKVLMFHGVSDAVFSADDTVALMHRIERVAPGRTGDFVRYFPVPGMAHCSAGPATDQFDALGPLVRWVEQGEAPAGLPAAAGPGAEMLRVRASGVRSRRGRGERGSLQGTGSRHPMQTASPPSRSFRRGLGRARRAGRPPRGTSSSAGASMRRSCRQARS